LRGRHQRTDQFPEESRSPPINASKRNTWSVKIFPAGPGEFPTEFSEDPDQASLKAISIPAQPSDFNRTAVYEQLDTSHIAAFIRSQKTTALAISSVKPIDRAVLFY
jgi:hypothetical protein